RTTASAPTPTGCFTPTEFLTGGLEMSFAYIYPASDRTDETYKAILGRVLADGRPAGLVLHVAGRDEDGLLQVLEVWESEEARDRFGEQALFPLFKEYGIDVSQGPGPVRIEVTNLML